MESLTIIIVAWNVRDLLWHCLLAVELSLANSAIRYEIIVVDNASSDGTTAMLQAEFPHVRVLSPGCNLGFAGGNNIALRALGYRTQPGEETGAGSREHAVLLLNPDTEPVGDALPRMVRYLERHPDIIGVGPQLRYPDGSIQSSRRHFPDRMTFFWESTPLERLWPANPWARRYHCAERSAECTQRVDWLVGAALLVRGDAIVRAGLLDEGFFLYSEEMEWQRRLQTSSGVYQEAANHASYVRPSHRLPPDSQHIAYLPDAVVIHHEGKSSEQVPTERHLHFQRSKIRLARLWYGPAFAYLLLGFLLVCYAWELAVESAKYMAGHRRSLRRQRIEIYIKVLRGLV